MIKQLSYRQTACRQTAAERAEVHIMGFSVKLTSDEERPRYKDRGISLSQCEKKLAPKETPHVRFMRWGLGVSIPSRSRPLQRRPSRCPRWDGALPIRRLHYELSVAGWEAVAYPMNVSAIYAKLSAKYSPPGDPMPISCRSRLHR